MKQKLIINFILVQLTDDTTNLIKWSKNTFKLASSVMKFPLSVYEVSIELGFTLDLRYLSFPLPYGAYITKGVGNLSSIIN